MVGYVIFRAVLWAVECVCACITFAFQCLESFYTVAWATGNSASVAVAAVIVLCQFSCCAIVLCF